MNLDIIDVSKFKGGANRRYKNKSKLMPKFPFNLLVCGKTNSGKSCMVLNLIYRLLSFSKLYFWSRHLNQPEIKAMVEFFKKAEEKCGDKILYTGDNLEELPPMDEFSPEHQNLLVIDDFLGDPMFNVVEPYIYSGSHRSISCIIITQQFVGVSRRTRLNCSNFCFFNINSGRELTNLYNELGQNCESKEEFIRKFKKSTEKKYDFFYVDQQTKIPELMYRCCFNKIIL